MFNFNQYLNSLNVRQLRNCQKILEDVISLKSNLETMSPNSDNPDIKDYVEYQEDFIKEEDKSFLLGEVESLNLKHSNSGNKVQNIYLSDIDEPYIWDSSNGPVINNPLKLDDYPNIKAVMTELNNQYNCQLNSVLISHYKNGNVNVGKHNDNEISMDASQPICVVSLGVKRQVEFIDCQGDSYRPSCLKLNPADRSVYTMKPGCQNHFLHRVRKDKRIKTGRYSLSFRCFVPGVRAKHNATVPATPAPVTPAVVKPDITPSVPSPPSAPGFSKSPDGYSPFTPNQSLQSKTSYGNDLNSDKICVIFGTSITSRVDENKLSRKNRTVVNCSTSGAKISDISEAVNEFVTDNIHIVNKVDKIILCLGTNDVKYFNSFQYSLRKRFWSPLTRLVDQVKLLFPGAQIIFKSLLPMRIIRKYTVDNVHLFNGLLIDICAKYGCIFFDCFRNFLDEHGHDVNECLYWDNFHLNSNGLKVLCRALKYVIYGQVFNPFMRGNHFPYYS